MQVFHFFLPRPSRKEKLDILGSRHIFLAKADDNVAEDSKTTRQPVAEEVMGDGELESVFTCSMLPLEFYMEMIHSLSSVGIVDSSPAQGLSNGSLNIFKHKCCVVNFLMFYMCLRFCLAG